MYVVGEIGGKYILPTWVQLKTMANFYVLLVVVTCSRWYVVVCFSTFYGHFHNLEFHQATETFLNLSFQTNRKRVCIYIHAYVYMYCIVVHVCVHVCDPLYEKGYYVALCNNALVAILLWRGWKIIPWVIFLWLLFHFYYISIFRNFRLIA